MTLTLKVTLTAAAMTLSASPFLMATAAHADTTAQTCKDGVVVNSYPPKTCKPSDPSGTGGGDLSGNGGGAASGNAGGGGGNLPFTGADIVALSGAGGALVVSGGVIFALGRRRKAASSLT